MKITLLIPTLNEMEGMRQIMPKIKREWYDELVVADGGSTDGTIEYCKENNYFVFVQKKPGIRNAYMEALEYITGDIIITFSPDGNSIPELIPPLIEKMKEGYDMVNVSRYLGDARSKDDNVMTGFGNWLFTNTINFLFGGRYTDALVIFRAYRTKLIYDLGLTDENAYRTFEKLFQCKLSWEPLLSIRAAKRKLKIGEIPGDEPARIGGEIKSRMSRLIRWAIAYYSQFIREIFFWR